VLSAQQHADAVFFINVLNTMVERLHRGTVARERRFGKTDNLPLT